MFKKVLFAALFAGLTATAVPVTYADEAGDPASAGEESLAYSHAMQAYLYTFPLFVTERERARREHLGQVIETSAVAPINRLGHMSQLANAQSDMPYSPNNDTVYTGVSMDLSSEPLILTMPAITDRYAVVQVINAYVENQPYHYSPRVNGGEAVNLAFVGPDWTGTLPEDTTRVQLDTNVAGLAIRIALTGDEISGVKDLSAVRDYQQQMSLTALSDWSEGPGVVAPQIPAPKEREKFKGPFARFQKAAVLLAENPPPARHHTINATLWRVGLKVGEPFDPNALSPATRRGVLRALEDAPAVMDHLIRNRGKKFPGGWDAGRYARDIVFDYAARAAMSLVGLVGNDPEEAIYLYTYFDSENEPLDGSKAYRMHFESDELPDIQDLGFWSLTMYDGENYRFVDNPIDRYSVGSRSALQRNADGSLDVYIQSQSPGKGKESNWLPSPESGSFRVTVRIYAPTQETVDALYNIDLALPPLERIE